MLVQAWIMVVDTPPPPLDETKEDNTSEVDLIDPEQEEESTVVIPSLPTVQEITDMCMIALMMDLFPILILVYWWNYAILWLHSSL